MNYFKIEWKVTHWNIVSYFPCRNWTLYKKINKWIKEKKNNSMAADCNFMTEIIMIYKKKKAVSTGTWCRNIAI